MMMGTTTAATMMPICREPPECQHTLAHASAHPRTSEGVSAQTVAQSCVSTNPGIKACHPQEKPGGETTIN